MRRLGGAAFVLALGALGFALMTTPPIGPGADAHAIATTAERRLDRAAFRACLPDAPADSEALAYAIVAVESTARTPLRRGAENGAARAWVMASGRAPDWSLGPAQMKPATAARYTSLRGARLVDELASACGAARLAHAHVGHLLAQEHDPRLVARAYRGGAEAGLYDEAVALIYARAV